MLNPESCFLIFNNISIENQESSLTIAAVLLFLGFIILLVFLVIQNAIRASKVKSIEKLKRERLKKFAEQNKDLYINDNDRSETVLKLKKMNTPPVKEKKSKAQEELEKDESIKYDIYKVKEVQDKVYNKPPSKQAILTQKEEEKEKLQQELLEKKRRLEEIKRAVNERMEDGKEELPKQEASRLDEDIEALKRQEEESRKLQEARKKQEEEEKAEQELERIRQEEEQKKREEVARLEKLKQQEETRREEIRIKQEEEQKRRAEEERIEEEEQAKRKANRRLDTIEESKYLEELRMEEKRKFEEERLRLQELRMQEEARLEEEKKKLEELKREEIRKLEVLKQQEEERQEEEAKREAEKIRQEELRKIEEERRKLIELRQEEEAKLEEEKRRIEALKQQEQEIVEQQERLREGDFNPLELIEQQFTEIHTEAKPENKVKNLLKQADLKGEEPEEFTPAEEIKMPPVQKEILKSKETKNIKELISKIPRERLDNDKKEEFIKDMMNDNRVVVGEKVEEKQKESAIVFGEKLREGEVVHPEGKEDDPMQPDVDLRKTMVENKTRSILEKINLIDEIEKKNKQSKYGVMNTLADDYRKVLLVISPENAGKTTVAVNLAYELANRGIRTTLIDTDNIKKDIYYYFPEDHMGSLSRLSEFETKEDLYALGIKVNESLTIFTENKSIEFEIDFPKLVRLIHYANQINEAVIIDVKTDMDPQQVRTLMDLTPYILTVVDKRLTTINRLANKFRYFKDIFVNKSVDLVINMDEGQRGLNKATIKNFLKKLEYKENGKMIEYAIQTKEIFSVAYDTRSIILALTSKLPAIMAKDNKIIFDIKKIGSYYFPN